MLWERKSFATKIRRWEDRILLRGTKGMCRWWIAEQGQWDTGQSPTQVSTTSITLGQWEASICLNMPITVGQAGVFQFCWLLIHIGQLQIKRSDEFGCVESSFRVNERGLRKDREGVSSVRHHSRVTNCLGCHRETIDRTPRSLDSYVLTVWHDKK